MPRWSRFSAGIAALTTVIALVAAFALASGNGSAPALPVTTPALGLPNTAPAYPPPTGSVIPPCAFSAADRPNPPAPPPLAAYHFGEPRVVLRHDSAIGIAGWLPDSERLLITRLVPGRARETIDLFDPASGELRSVGERAALAAPPIWLPATQAVAFADGERWPPELRISTEKANGTTVLSTLASPWIAASPDGRYILGIAQSDAARPAQAILLDLTQPQALRRAIALPETPSSALAALGQQFGPEPYQAVWSPRGDQVAIFNDTGFYLLTVATNQLCTVDLGREESEAGYGQRWAHMARWSPNGQYLALLTTTGDFPLTFIDLSILDLQTGKILNVNPEQSYVQDVAWDPFSYVLALLVTVEHRDGTTWEGLYLAETVTGKAYRMLPQSTFPAGDAGWNLAWSSSGKVLAVVCLDGPLCLIDVDTP